MTSGGRDGHTHFDDIAHVYDESLPPHVVEHYLRKRLAFIRRHVESGPVLDVGCGTGKLAGRVADAGYRVHGVDPSRAMLQLLRERRPDIGTAVSDGTSLPFAEGTFALTYCVAVLHHIADADAVRRALAEMVRVTRPGGDVLVWDHNPRNPYWPVIMRKVPQDHGDERLVSAKEVVDGLVAGGARPVEISQLGLMPDFVPRSLVGTLAAVETLAERTPGLRRLCAHNVVLAVKGESVATVR